MQGTCRPVLPVHTTAERLMFWTLMIKNKEFNPPNVSEPPWNQAVKVWNAFVDESNDENLYYKVSNFRTKIFQFDQIHFQLSDQLKVYYAQWRKSLDIKEALSRSSGIRKPLANDIHDLLRSVAAPPIPFQSRMPHVVEKGFVDSEQEPSHSSERQ